MSDLCLVIALVSLAVGVPGAVLFLLVYLFATYKLSKRSESPPGITFDPEDFFEPRLCSCKCFLRIYPQEQAPGVCECGAFKYCAAALCCNKCSVQKNCCASCLKSTSQDEAFRTGMFGPWLHKECTGRFTGDADLESDRKKPDSGFVLCLICGKRRTQSCSYELCIVCSARRKLCQRCGNSWYPAGGFIPLPESPGPDRQNRLG